MWRRDFNSRAFIALVISILLCTFLGIPASPAVAAPSQSECPAQAAAIEAVHAKIDAHNAKPHVFSQSQAAAAAAYDAEAAALEAEQATDIANLQACAEAMDALADTAGSSQQPRPLTDTTRSALAAAQEQIPADWQPPAAPPPNQNWTVPRGTPPRALFDVLRKATPGNVGNVTFQGQPRPAVGAPDPAYPAALEKVFGTNAGGLSNARPDHIIPLAELINTPGFVKLTPENMWAIVNAPLNYQWLSPGANSSKSSHSVAAMGGVDPQWQAEQAQLEQRTRQQLRDIIDKLLKSQGS
jgi:hypothetical protein